ncbi:acyl carrier protein [Micromonospora sp. DT48]|uniref:acyl carrier protein n=1 Tax=unclassified Micromonospora TaxID=2617518 RepID=UPI0012BD6CC4|nr:acyl carrier protein [Micromonospora sp. CP22]MTK02387.1 acyl carrier protein [Micromonospora sp. CP22]
MTATERRVRIAELVSAATGGAVAVDDVLSGESMIALGVDSLALLRLVDAIELEYGVEVELAGGGRAVDSVDDVVALLADQDDRATAPGTREV